MKALLAAIQFLTIVPVRAQLTEHDFARSPRWFPAVGLLIGAIVALADLAMTRLPLSPVLLSILSITLLAALSGGLHLDGLADTADGFLSARPKERVLEIMRDSHIGTMGVLALVFVLVFKVAALAELAGTTRWRTLVLAPVAGRCMLTVGMGLLPYARRDNGLATIFICGTRKLDAVWTGLLLAAMAVILFGIGGGAIRIIAAAATTTVLCLWTLRRIGGFTGDTLGATSEIVEATILFCSCLRIG